MERPISGRIKALDGFRGIAVTIVILRHLVGAPGTWMGVDVFFVLSGFLITTILRGEREDPNFWKVFYIRRITRIVPAFLILMAAAALLLPFDWHRLWPYCAFFGGNIAVITLGDAAVGPLSVIWSLAVEEHFYFLWPINVKFLKDRTLTRILLGILICEPILRVACLTFITDWRPFNYLTPFRLDALAVGCLLSILLSQPSSREQIERRLNPSLVIASAACAVAFGVFHLSRQKTLPMNAFGFSLIAVTTGLVLAWVVLRPQSPLTKIIAWTPFCFLGRISYGLYLYHLLLRDVGVRIAQAHGYTHNVRSAIVTLPFSIFLAWLSFEFIERRFLDFGRRKVGAYRTVEGPVHTTS